MYKVFLIILIIPIVLAANSYNVPAGTKENKIILDISNKSNQAVHHLNIKPVYDKTCLKVYNVKNIQSVAQNNSDEIEFSFDVTDEAKIGSTYRINFQFYAMDNLITEKQIDILVSAPDKFEVMDNYPNPFNPATTISYKLPVKSAVKIDIYNVSGQKVESLLDDSQDAGVHSIKWNGSGMSSGIYFYRIMIDNDNGSQSLVKRMTLIK